MHEKLKVPFLLHLLINYKNASKIPFVFQLLVYLCNSHTNRLLPPIYHQIFGQNMRLPLIFCQQLSINAVSALSMLFLVETGLRVIDEGPNVLGPPR